MLLSIEKNGKFNGSNKVVEIIDNIDDDMIYAQLASGEFRLYEAMVWALPVARSKNTLKNVFDMLTATM